MKLFESGSCLIIAEVAQAHDGSLGTAHAYIDAVAETGVDAVKFQTHIAAEESIADEPWRTSFSRQDSSRYEYWQRMEFSEHQWRGLADHANEKGLMFLSTPFSSAAAEMLERVGVSAWKIGSGDINHLPLLEWVAQTGKPVVLSSGLSTWQDLDAAVDILRNHDTPLAVLQCTTAYPCPPEQVGLNLLAELRHRYDCPVGLSDHSGTIFAGLAAVTLGAEILETHVVLDRRCFGPDVAASVTVDELAQLVRGARFIENALANPVDKQQMAAQLKQLRKVFGRSIVAARDLPAGHLLTPEDLSFKKPAAGIPADRWRQLIGHRLLRPAKRDSILSEDDLD
jgi:N-acetylneuraminate synthase